MSRPILFASVKPLERAENIHALYDAFDGQKEFIQVNGCRRHESIRSGAYDLMVIDEFPSESPGKCIMIGHGIWGGKKCGLDQPDPYYHAYQAPLMTYVITSGTDPIKPLSKELNVPEERILPYGMPRTDAYVGKKKGDGHSALAEKRSYLYVPTFRTPREPPFPQIDWDWLDDALTDDELLVVKGHMATDGIGVGIRKHIVEYSPYIATEPYLIDCDVVISDYSTVIFDGYLLQKPAVLFEKDSGYVESRGMYLEYPDEYCSRYCKDEESLLRMVREADGLTETERKVIRKVASACDGHAIERVCSLIHQMSDPH